MTPREKIAQFMHEHPSATMAGIYALGVTAVFTGFALHELGKYLNQKMSEAIEYRSVCRFETKNPEKEDFVNRLNQRIEECYDPEFRRADEYCIGIYDGLCVFRLEDEVFGIDGDRLKQGQGIEFKCEERHEE